MMEYNSVDDVLFYRTLNGRKSRTEDNAFLSVSMGEFEGIDRRVLIFMLHAKSGATLQIGLLAHEAEELGMFLMSIGARTSALNEESFNKKMKEKYDLSTPIQFDPMEIPKRAAKKVRIFRSICTEANHA